MYIPLRLYSTPCVFHSVCIPLHVYPTPYVFHSVYPIPYIPLRVSHSVCIQLLVYPILCLSRSVCIQLRVYSTLISYSVCVPLRVPLHAYPTSCVSHFMFVPLLYLTLCVPLHVSHVPIHVSHFLYVLLYVSHSSYIPRKSDLYIPLLVCPAPCMSHSVCPTWYSFYISLRIGPTSRESHFLSMCSTPCVSVYRPLFVFVR